MIPIRDKDVCIIDQVVVGNDPPSLALHQNIVQRLTGTAVYLLDSRRGELQQLWHPGEDVSEPERAKPYLLSSMRECVFSVCTNTRTRARKVLLRINGDHTEVGCLAEGVDVNLAALLQFNDAVAAHCCGDQRYDSTPLHRIGRDFELDKIP